ncbi:unnamed protein product [Anisakis simplex]|uniref:Uncharacterized protein n=1 Tax=Anisakis simplex TaxID=6269 RepID=A0A0M3JH88_ANISI|nr:unnamed protein product [Anisakis simplex]
MRRKIVEEEERREKLSEGFEQRKAENEARRVLERQREEQYKKEQLKQQLESERLTQLALSQRAATPPRTPEPIPQIQEQSHPAHLQGISDQVIILFIIIYYCICNIYNYSI